MSCEVGHHVVVRSWTVASAVIETAVDGRTAPDCPSDAVLLVRNLRVNGTEDWTTPGGVVDDGESVLQGLEREVLEETGLVVTGWSGLLYEIRAEAPELGWDLTVEVHRAAGFSGEVSVGDDPDGIVTGSAWVGSSECRSLLAEGHPWVREPLLEWMQHRWERPRRFEYRVEGASIGDISVIRLR